MAELLFEIFCEEIPARMQVRAGADLSKALTDGLKKAGLKVEGVQVMTGPRRLVFAADIPLRSPDVSEERKGPRVGSPDQALAGFLRGAGLSDISETEVRTDPKKGDFYVAVLNSEGRDTKDILAELIPDIMNNFPWPKSMKSGGTTFRWVRPLQRVICLLDGAVVPFGVGGVQSGDVTEGHRRHGKGPFKISDLKGYIQSLEKEGHVVLTHDKRKQLIIEQARKACADKGLELVEDEGLLNEVAGLVEWPIVILGDMDPSFLELPGEVIRLSMRTHQKYFAVRNPKSGNLAPHFIVVANQDAPDGGKAIAEGNSRVLSARLADAQFFQSEDAKLKLENYYEKLDTVVFHKKLGSIKDKAERVAALARELAPKVGADPDKAEQAAKLAKCDLVTNMVIEFTSLEGQIGRLMYEREGGDKDIALAIEEHYKPKGPSDAVPTNPVAVAVALADKLDTLVGFWAIDEKPTGSKDPFALRRAFLGTDRNIRENNVRTNLTDMILLALKKYPETMRVAFLKWKPSSLEQALKEEEGSLFQFVFDRLEYSLKEFLRIDLIRAVLVLIKENQIEIFHPSTNERIGFAPREIDLVAIVNRVTVLQSFLSTKDGENLLSGYKRAANILKAEAKKGNLTVGIPNRPVDENGAALYDALQSSSKSIKTALENEDFEKAMFALAELRAPIDAFFTHVQVISDDTAVRENNLRLLGLIRDTARQIADFEAING